MSGRSDSLSGLKENVILGKLIPAGTGFSRYRGIEVEPTEEAKAQLYPSFGYDAIDYSPLTEADPSLLEELDLGHLDDFRRSAERRVGKEGRTPWGRGRE